MAQAEIKTVATLDNAPFKAGIGGMSSQLSGLKGIIAGAFSVGAIVSFGRSMLQTADSMKQIGDATNLQMGSMVALKTVAAENNMGFDQMSKVLGKLRNAQGEVVSLSKPMLDALQKLGITAEEFVGIPVDEVLEKIAKKFSESGGSADAFNAVTAIFGEKIGPKMMDMLRALADEGMVNLKKRTEDATKGFEDLSKAQSNLEKFKSGAELKAGELVGAGMEIGAAKDRLVGSGGIFGAIKRFFNKSKGPVFGKDDYTGQPDVKKPLNLAKPVDPAIAADQATLAANKRNVAQKAVDAELARIEKKAMSNDDYINEREKTINEFSKKRADLMAGTAPAMDQADALQRIGGLVGGMSGGSQVARIAERQAKAAEAIETLTRETNSKLADLNRKMDGIVEE
jgi:hypothetical protein